MKTMYTNTKRLIIALMAMTVFTSCSTNDEDGYIASTLRNHDWQGYIEAYYQDRWGITGSEYSTVMHFSSKDAYYTSGRGEELDFNINSPRANYAYCTFKWFIVDGEITLIYDDSKWSPIYIIDYRLNSSVFQGYIYDGSNRRIQFSFENAGAYNDWGYYNNGRYGGYGDFSNQNYYWSRTRAAEGIADSVPFIDRTEQARQESGEPDAVSILSGVFAVER